MSANAFTIQVGDDVNCQLDQLTLAEFSNVQADPSRSEQPTSRKLLVLEHADNMAQRPNAVVNASSLINSMATTYGNQIELKLTPIQQLQFTNYYQHDLDMEHSQFVELIEQKQSNDNQVDKQPSTHVPDIKPAVTAGASSDLNGQFVAANAESHYQYQATEVILSKAKLTDSQGKAIAGIQYFSAHSRGITDSEGYFEFNWGDNISFGIDTFELGSIRGNQTQFTLSQLGHGDVGQNIEQLVLRYSTEQSQHWQLAEQVNRVFSQYPNAINEIISLSLTANDKILDLGNGQTQTISAEFEQQFKQGLAQQIDQQICANGCQAPAQRQLVEQSSNQILTDIQKLWGSTAEVQQQGWLPVKQFHVFHDSTNFYGSTGNARGQAAVNIANTAFPVMMARNDNNYWLPFGQQKAWDQHGLAYITEAPSTVIAERVGANTATFNLPFISIGEMGQGKVMVMGNARYNSILVCPNGYSWQGGVDNQGQCTNSNDSDDMKHFMKNVLNYLSHGQSGYTIGTNIPLVYFKRHGQVTGNSAPYQIHPDFNVATEQVSQFSHLDPQTMPIVMINGFEYLLNPNGNHYELPLRADTEQAKLTQQDATDLIDYVSRGGNVLVMETLLDMPQGNPLARLLDSAGIAFGIGQNVVNNGNGPNQGYPDRVRSHNQLGAWVIERYAAVEGEDNKPTTPYIINADGSVDWLYQLQGKPDDKPKLEVASWTETNDQGEQIKHLAYIDVANSKDIAADKARILNAFKKADDSLAYSECKDSNYHYEVNCLEYRPGNGIALSGGMYVPHYTELSLGNDEAKAMVQAANLGDNIERLYQHERYFRSKGKQGERLNSVDLERIYQNMSVWLWNNLDYRFQAGIEDELGFERFTQMLNCYSDNRAAGGTVCPTELRTSMQSLSMIYGDDAGQYADYMNPSYPLNYMEKPLTRLMLGRSFWDLDIKVDIRQYPGEANASPSNHNVTLDLSNRSAAWFAGSRQATGQWAVAQQPFTISANSNQPITITVALNDDLTGREKHELGLMRPPRISQSITLNSGDIGNSYTMTVPYGGLIYAKAILIHQYN